MHEYQFPTCQEEEDMLFAIRDRKVAAFKNGRGVKVHSRNHLRKIRESKLTYLHEERMAYADYLMGDLAP